MYYTSAMIARMQARHITRIDVEIDVASTRPSPTQLAGYSFS
jgi:hypothetical protein